MIVEENVGDQGDEHNPQEKNRAEEREICKNEGRSRIFTAEKLLDILDIDSSSLLRSHRTKGDLAEGLST